MATKLKKGTEVWWFNDWNHGATVSIRRVIITSLGKIQGTAVHYENGNAIEHRIYADSTVKNMVPVADMPDPTNEALRRAAEQKAKWIQHYVACAHAYADTTTPHYHEGMRRECQALIDEQPSVIFK